MCNCNSKLLHQGEALMRPPHLTKGGGYVLPRVQLKRPVPGPSIGLCSKTVRPTLPPPLVSLSLSLCICHLCQRLSSRALAAARQKAPEPDKAAPADRYSTALPIGAVAKTRARPPKKGERSRRCHRCQCQQQSGEFGGNLEFAIENRSAKQSGWQLA